MKIILYGKPRSGKTTLVKKVLEKLRGKRVSGFLTEEVLLNGKRVGFELVDIKTGRRKELARKGIQGKYMLGAYSVDVLGFEQFLEEIDISDSDLIVVDEIGKMECLSQKFCFWIENLVRGPYSLLLTVPEKGNVFIEELKKTGDFLKIRVTERNRNSVYQEVLSLIERI